MYNNKSILVTGGTGSFGKKFIDFITQKYSPKRVVVYSRDELKQSQMSEKYNKSYMRYFIGDIRDFDRLNLAMREIDICIHAAAMKQVVASEYNPMEAIKTNVIGAENIVRSSLENNLKNNSAVVPYLNSDNSVKYKSNKKINNLNRDKILLTQTPQCFNFNELFNCSFSTFFILLCIDEIIFAAIKL